MVDDETVLNDVDLITKGAPVSLRGGRRLEDKIFAAFHQACDQMDLIVAERLLDVMEMMLTRRPRFPDRRRRRNMEHMVAAHERLWTLRHPDVVLKEG